MVVRTVVSIGIRGLDRRVRSGKRCDLIASLIEEPPDSLFQRHGNSPLKRRVNRSGLAAPSEEEISPIARLSQVLEFYPNRLGVQNISIWNEIGQKLLKFSSTNGSNHAMPIHTLPGERRKNLRQVAMFI